MFKNIRISFLAQLSSIVVSVGMGLVLPKFLSVENYGYWQLFVTYSVCFETLLFGMPNGFFLKNAGKTNNDYDYLKTSFFVLMIINISIGIIVILFTNNASIESIVYYWIGIAVIIINSGTFYSYILRTENDVAFDCIAIIILNLSILLGLCTVFLLNIINVEIVIGIYVLSFLIRDVLLLWRKRVLFLAKLKFTDNFFKEFSYDSKIGIKTLLIDYTNILMFGIFRLICKNEMGVTLFSMLSFALSLVILAINFVNQVGLSILPSLRQLDETSVKEAYIKLRNFTSNLFVALMLTYKPAIFILSHWLPKYIDSFFYILLLFPLIIFDGKMQTIFSLFLKMLRKESLLLKINMIYFVSSIVAFLFVIRFTNNIKYVVLLILIFSFIRSTIVESIISRIININGFGKKIFLEFATSIVFLGSNCSDGWIAWFYFAVFDALVLCLNMKKCKII